jgi:IMP dehydrogenase
VSIPTIPDLLEKFAGEGLTFDDVSLVTNYADFLPDDSDVSSNFSRGISLNIPFVSAAMDTVTESQMAIAMALNGGVGVIHKNLSAARQAEEVRRVKSYLNGLIEQPLTFCPEATVAELLAEKDQRKLSFTGFPIADDDGTLRGIFTARDLKFVGDNSKKIKDVMTAEVITAPIGTTLMQAYELMVSNRVGKLPIVDKNGKLAGLYSFHDVKSLVENDEPAVNRDAHHKLRVAAAVSPYDYDRCDLLIEAGVDALVIDTAHGHSKGVVETVQALKKCGGDYDVIAGNVGTEEGGRALVEAGADAVKVGIGPGSICTTRVVCGVGIPQLTAIYETSKGVQGEVPIIADGGIKFSGDVPKALAVGASCVMMGSALAGTAQSPGEKILHQGRTYVVYRGMGSVEAMKKGKGSRERYGHKDVDSENKLVPQGIEGLVQYRGDVENVLTQYVGGVRFSLGYCGSRNLAELRQKAKFVRVTNAGLLESHPHDVKIIKDAPNYRSGRE